MKSRNFFCEIFAKKFQKGVDKVFLWVYNAERKGKDAIYFQESKNNFIYEEGKDVSNVVGDTPTVKGKFSFFIKEEAVCRMQMK